MEKCYCEICSPVDYIDLEEPILTKQDKLQKLQEASEMLQKYFNLR